MQNQASAVSASAFSDFFFGLAFVTGFWTACTIGFDPTDTDLQFSCTTDQDCIAPNKCNAGVCVTSDNPGGTCVDADDDGYGVGDTADCPSCTDQADCSEDCNDDDPTINPSVPDICDGKDNDCSGEPDQVIACENGLDCPSESPYIVTCPSGTCEYTVPNAFGGDPACVPPVACVGGMREDRPESCF